MGTVAVINSYSVCFYGYVKTSDIGSSPIFWGHSQISSNVKEYWYNPNADNKFEISSSVYVNTFAGVWPYDKWVHMCHTAANILPVSHTLFIDGLKISTAIS